MNDDHEQPKQSPGPIDIDLTKAALPMHRFKLTAEEVVLLQKGIEHLDVKFRNFLGAAYESLKSKFECTDFFIVMYTSGIKSRRKKRVKEKR